MLWWDFDATSLKINIIECIVMSSEFEHSIVGSVFLKQNWNQETSYLKLNKR